MKTYYDLTFIQADLDKHILENHNLSGKDLYLQKKTALLVELGELANELRFFKFWSIDRKSRFTIPCSGCKGTGSLRGDVQSFRSCPVCHGTGEDTSKNPALEEYVDCLHFILSISLDIRSQEERQRLWEYALPLHYNNLDEQFGQLFYEISGNLSSKLELVINYFLGLGELIGFTEEQIIEAYLKKNKINHNRQVLQY